MSNNGIAWDAAKSARELAAAALSEAPENIIADLKRQLKVERQKRMDLLEAMAKAAPGYEAQRLRVIELEAENERLRLHIIELENAIMQALSEVGHAGKGYERLAKLIDPRCAASDAEK